MARPCCKEWCQFCLGVVLSKLRLLHTERPVEAGCHSIYCSLKYRNVSVTSICFKVLIASGGTTVLHVSLLTAGKSHFGSVSSRSLFVDGLWSTIYIASNKTGNDLFSHAFAAVTDDMVLGAAISFQVPWHCCRSQNVVRSRICWSARLEEVIRPHQGRQTCFSHFWWVVFKVMAWILLCVCIILPAAGKYMCIPAW